MGADCSRRCRSVLYNLDVKNLVVASANSSLFFTPLASLTIVSYNLLSNNLAMKDSKYTRDVHVPDPLDWQLRRDLLLTEIEGKNSHSRSNCHDPIYLKSVARWFNARTASFIFIPFFQAMRPM